MNSLSPFLSVPGSAEEALVRLRPCLARAGLRVLQTFDLNGARLAAADCPCPHHGQADCDCQMLVLLVYGEAAPPVTLVLHSNDGQTWLSLVDSPAERPESSIRFSIEQALHDNSPKEGL